MNGCFRIIRIVPPMFSCIKCVQVFSASPYATPVSKSVNAVIVIISIFIFYKFVTPQIVFLKVPQIIIF